MQKVVKRILKKCSLEYIEVDKARKVANLKSIGVGKKRHNTIDTKVMRGGYAIPVRLFFPDKESKSVCQKGRNQLPVILYLHGGGWVTDNIDNYERICHRLSRYTTHLVISVDYHLAPEYKYPTGLLDSYEVVKDVCLGTFPYPVNTKDITIMGDSAGGNLSAAICQKARNERAFALKNQVLIYPVVQSDYSANAPYESLHTKGQDYGLTIGKMKDYVTLYKSCDQDLMDPYFSPMLEEDLTALPQALVITAENDPLRDEGEAYAGRLQEAGNHVQTHRIKDGVHGYFGVGMNGPFVRETLQLIDEFLKEK